MSCRLLIDPQPGSGAWNMAVDEVLLEAAVGRGETVVRWYRWSEATLSLGYFQSAQAEREPLLASLPAVRRLTGGGAILHHYELTYSCAIPAEHPFAREPLRLYEEVHRAIISVLAARGITAAMRGASAGGSAEPFLCFGRGDPRDVVVAGHKVLGSAQRRRRGAVLQHGSLLLCASPFAPAFAGLNDLVGRREIGADDAGGLARALAKAVGGRAGECALSVTEQQRAAALASSRYSRLNWPAVSSVAAVHQDRYYGD